MTMKSSSNMMKIMGATLAVCSACAIMGSSKANTGKSIKKTMQKTADKMVNFVDTVASIM